MAELAKFFVAIGSKFDDKGIKAGMTDIEKLRVIGGNLGRQLKTIALAGAAMGTAIAIGAKKAADAAGIQEQKEIALAAAMKTAGTFTQEAFEHNLKYASSLQRVTTFGDETILSVQKLLTNYGAQGEELDSLTAATLDFATATGMNLEAAAALLGKTIGSSTNALTRYGIEVEGGVGSTERMQSAVEGITKLFGGAAQAEANTYAGRMQQLSNRWGDFIEKIGFIAIPIIEQLVDVIDKHILPALEDWISVMNQGSGFAENFGNTLKFIINVARGVIKIIDTLSDGIIALGLALTGQFGAAKEALVSFQNKFVEFGTFVGEATAARVKQVEVAERAKLDARRRTLIEGLKLTKDAADEEEEIRKNSVEGFIGLTKELNKLGNEVFDEDKKRREALKPLLVAEATANTYVGATKALAQGGVLGILTSASVIATGLAQVSNIVAQRFEKGVRNFAGGLALVGERGPELVKLPRGADVIPAGPSRTEMHNAGRGGNVYNINVNVMANGSRRAAREQGEIYANEFFKKISRARKLV